MRLEKYFLVGLIALNLFGCGGGRQNPTDTTTTPPTLSINCISSQAAQCDNVNAGAVFYLGLIAGADADCQTPLSNHLPGQFFAAFEASASIASQIGNSQLNGQVSAWVDNSNVSLTSIDVDQYVVCGYLDTNGNEQLDSGEPWTKGSIDLRFLRPYEIDLWQNNP